VIRGNADSAIQVNIENTCWFRSQLEFAIVLYNNNNNNNNKLSLLFRNTLQK